MGVDENLVANRVAELVLNEIRSESTEAVPGVLVTTAAMDGFSRLVDGIKLRCAPPPPEITEVYFIRASSGPIKIGVAKDPRVRLRTLQTSTHERLSLLATLVGTYETERDLHRKFAHLRLSGEWFAPSDELLAFVECLKGKAVAE